MNYNKIHLYVGYGKGKTSAAYGLALRAMGNNMRVLVVSFLKSENSGELTMLKKINETFGFPQIYVSLKKHSFYFNLCEEEKKEVKNEVEELFAIVEKAIISKEYDLIVLDEIIDAVNLGLIDEKKLISLLKLRNSEIVLTGRNPSEEISGISDYISNIEKIKHPFDCGISARKGIEF